MAYKWSEFCCSVPTIQSAIKVGGDGSIRLQLDIPSSELPEAIKLVMAQGKVINATLQWEDEGDES